LADGTSPFRAFSTIWDLDLGLPISGCYSRESWLTESGHTEASGGFGFSPKFSTTVENTVENPGVPHSSAEKRAVLQGFFTGETVEIALRSAFAAGLTAQLMTISRGAKAKVQIS